MTTNRAGYMRAYYESHKEQIQAQQRAYYKRKQAERQANPWLLDTRVDYKTPTREDFQAVPKEKELTYSQKYYAENRERIREKQKETRAKKKRNEKQRAYYAANKEHLCELSRKSYAKRQREKKLSKTFLGRLYLKVFG